MKHKAVSHETKATSQWFIAEATADEIHISSTTLGVTNLFLVEQNLVTLNNKVSTNKCIKPATKAIKDSCFAQPVEYNQCKHDSVWGIHTFRTSSRGYTG